MEFTREHYRAMVFYNFEVKLNNNECFYRQKLAYENKANLMSQYSDGLYNFVEVTFLS